MWRKSFWTVLKGSMFLILAGVFLFAGTAFTPGGQQSDTAVAWPWSPYANVYVQVSPYNSIGANAYVWLWDGNGKYYGCLKTDDRWGTTHQVNFGSVYVDKPLKIKVQFMDGTIRYYYPKAGRPTLNKRVIRVEYNGSWSG